MGKGGVRVEQRIRRRWKVRERQGWERRKGKAEGSLEK
jgi:hypothetical protein